MSDPAQTTKDDLEKYKFVSTGPAKSDIAIKVTNPDGTDIGGGGSSNPFAPPAGTMSFTVAYPTSFQTVYSFWSGPGGSGTLLQTVTLNFATAQTPDLTSGEVA